MRGWWGFVGVWESHGLKMRFGLKMEDLLRLDSKGVKKEEEEELEAKRSLSSFSLSACMLEAAMTSSYTSDLTMLSS